MPIFDLWNYIDNDPKWQAWVKSFREIEERERKKSDSESLSWGEFIHRLRERHPDWFEIDGKMRATGE